MENQRLIAINGGKLYIHNNYIFKFKANRTCSKYYVCKTNNCKASLTVRKDKVISRDNHQHASDVAQIKAIKCVMEMKKRTFHEPTPIPQIYKEEISKEVFEEEVYPYLPSYDSIKSQLYRIRASDVPPLSPPMDTEGESSHTTDGQEFFLSDEGSSQNRIIWRESEETYKMVREVDLRSDTVTKPTEAMRKAMAEAVVGDDVYKEDPTINELERRIAELLGKEAALFVPSGTMGNLSAVMAHCWTRGQEALIGDESHIFMYEQGGVSQLGGVFVSAVPTKEDGTFDLDILESKIRPRTQQNQHEPVTRLICLENTHNRCGGKVLSTSYIEKVCELANKYGILVHMDGARIINASVALGVPPKEIVKNCASVSMCLSKGIGAPVGSVVAGSKDFISRVHRCRKVLGGAMRQAGVLAAAALVALNTAESRISIDHQRSKKLAQDIFNLKSELITVNPDEIQSNMLLLCFPSDRLTSVQFLKRMAEVTDQDEEKVVVKASAWFRNRVRCVLHSDLTQEDLDCAFRKIRSIAY